MPLIAAIAEIEKDSDENWGWELEAAQPLALVLAPTRELAIQIEKECNKLCFGAPPPGESDDNTRDVKKEKDNK